MYFDIFCLIFVLLFSFSMMRKGGAQALLSLVSVILSVVIALGVYPYLSEFLYKTPLDENIGAIVEESLMEKSMEEVSDIASAMPDFFAAPLEGFIADGAEATCAQVAGVITESIINIITFVLVLIATRLILFLLSGMLDVVTKLPVLKQANSFVGFLCGLVVSFVIVSVIVHILGIFAVNNDAVSMMLDTSYAVEIIENVSPF